VTIGSSWFIAIRYLLGRGREGGRYLRGAAIGIALSLVPIVVTLMVADGMIRGIMDRYLELGTGHLQIYDYRRDGDHASILEKLESLDGIRGAWPERQGLGIIVGRKGKSGASIRGVSPAFLEDGGTLEYLKAVEGTSHLSDGRDVLLGEELARSIGAALGDTVRLMTARTTGDGRTIPRLTPFVVKGIVSSGYRELDALWCIVSYEAGVRLLSSETSRSYVMVKIEDPYGGISGAADQASRLLGSRFGVYTWGELQESQFKSYQSTRQLLLFIMALVVLVAAVNVSAATTMLAVERRRDMAVLKSFGADSGGNSRIFLFGSFLAGTAGSIAGIGLGVAIGCSINYIIAFLERISSGISMLFHGSAYKILDPEYYLSSIPVVVDWTALGAIFASTILCSILAAWAPARRAGRLAPAEILRKY